jgi:flagellar basal-body rod protein FlgC
LHFTEFRNRPISARRYDSDMGLGAVLSIALSGMNAASRRLEVSASNVANASSGGPTADASAETKASYPPAYIAQRVDQVEVPGGGTVATVGPETPGTISEFDPTAPYADAKGMVAAPNVDLANEAVQQILARENFAANVQVVRVYQRMMQSLLDIKS